jgi:hypothetical protein
MNTALEYSTRVVQEGGRQCKKSTLNDLVHLTPLRIPLMNPPSNRDRISPAAKFQADLAEKSVCSTSNTAPEYRFSVLLSAEAGSSGHTHLYIQTS